jgi:hypothetical protein
MGVPTWIRCERGDDDVVLVSRADGHELFLEQRQALVDS